MCKVENKNIYLFCNMCSVSLCRLKRRRIGITFVGGGGVVVVVGGVRISFTVSGDTSVSMKHV